MPDRVVDASVLVAWCFREPRALEAFGLLQDSDIYAPSILAYELASIARKKTLAHPESLDVLREALETALALPIRWSNVDHGAVLRLALDAGLTTYDASYLFLARVFGVSLATFDQQLSRVARGTGG